MEDIVNLYKKFSKYKSNSNKDLHNHILPSIQCNQFKKFEDDKGLYGFVNWAFLNKENEDYYKWLYDIVIIRNARMVMSWVYNYFKDYLKTNECINWLRLDNNNNIYRVSKKFKRKFHS